MAISGEHMQVVCDKGCKKEFEINVKMVANGEIEKSYFNCPYCNEEYIAFYTNALIRKLQGELLELTQRKKRAQKVHLRIIKLKKKIKYQMNLLKQDIEKVKINDEDKMS